MRILAIMALAIFTTVGGFWSGGDVWADMDEERRARNGSVEAMVSVGERYLMDGDRRSLMEAYSWLRLAEEWGGLPQFMFGRHRDALRRLRATGGEEAVAEAKAIFEAKRMDILETLGRVEGESEKNAANSNLLPGPDDIRMKVGRLLLTYRGGSVRGCTATVIDSQHVLTAAHCLDDHETGEFAMAAFFLPGYSGAIGDQGAAAVADLAVWDPKWREMGQTADVAVIRLTASPEKRPVTIATDGVLPFGAPPEKVENVEVRLVGYPFAEDEDASRMPSERLVDRNCTVSDTDDGRLLRSTELCEMAQGASGGPVLAWNAEAARVEIVGVTSFIAPQDNEAYFARFTPEILERLNLWITDPSGDPDDIVVRDLIPRPVYWLSVSNQCVNSVRVGVIGRPYDSNDSRTYTREVLPGASEIVAGPLSEPDPVANITDARIGTTLFGEDRRMSIGGRNVPTSVVPGGDAGYGRIELVARCSGG
jgi:V8-like Glu-specific endopeptidase